METQKSNTPWTPGPWTPDDGFMLVEDMARVLKDDEGTEREWCAVGIEDGEGYAANVAFCHPINARLVAAAPEMAALLEQADELDDVADSDYDACMALEKIGAAARALLAKIKG